MKPSSLPARSLSIVLDGYSPVKSWVIHTSMSRNYELFSKPLHIDAKQWFLD